ncbi:MAG: restriction endonuclease subunit S [Betaproteobacteria bacterium]|nr:restriction endonuclease subunit S [Betaproteobacteria bacterium]
MSELEVNLWELPPSWKWTTMGDAAEIVGGGTPSTINSENFGGAVPWITPADMSTHVGKLISRGARSISEQGLQSSGARWLPKGSVLFSSRAPIGYVAIAANSVTTNQGFKNFVPKRGIASDFVYHWLTSAKPLAEKLASGTTFLEISGAKAALIPFPVAPTTEQTRIVEKLEELLSDLDAGVAELKAAQKKLTRYRQSLLKAAVAGALTAEWRAERARRGEAAESGAQLLARILVERRARWEAKQLAKFKQQGKAPPKDWKDKYQEPGGTNVLDLPKLPADWAWASIEQVVCEIRSGTAETSVRVPSPYPVLKSSAVRPGKVDMKALNFLTHAQSHRRENFLDLNDVLITRLSGSVEYVGCCAIVRTVPECGIQYPDRVFCGKLLPTIGWFADFLVYWFSSPYVRAVLERAAKSTAGHKRISLSDILPLPIPIPPSAETDEILRVVTDSLDRIEGGVVAVDMAFKQSSAQRKNILKAAFSGQLVPQEPNDEPAGVLLERIRAERAAQPGQKAPRPFRGKVTA